MCDAGRIRHHRIDVRDAAARFRPDALLVGESCTAELIQDQPGALEHFPAGALFPPTGPRPATTLTVRRAGEAAR